MMVKGKEASVKFKKGCCRIANKKDVDDPDIIAAALDRHVLVKLKEAVENEIHKAEEHKVTLENRKEKLPLDDEQNYELWKSIRDRLGECLVQGKLQKKS